MRFVLYLFCCFISEAVWAADYSTQVENIKIEQVADNYILDVDIIYNLSPLAKEALLKGIPLTWRVFIKVKQQGVFWDHSVADFSLIFQIQNHPLLGLYSITNVSSGTKDMFSTFFGALNYMSNIRALPLINKALIKAKQKYYVVVKVKFEHELLPVPIRPFSYFDSQWTLSSSSVLCPLKN